MTVYIPCYFNNIEERKEVFYNNLRQYLKLGYSLKIYWMNDENFLIEDDKIELIKGAPVNANIARNVLLRMFYVSDEDYALFNDDDTFLKSRLISELDCVSFTNDYDKELKQTEKIATGCLYISNFKKKYNLEMLFDESLEANQDLDFGMNLNKNGIKTYRQSVDNIIVYSGKSSMFKNNMNKINKKQKSLEYILNKYKNDNQTNI